MNYQEVFREMKAAGWKFERNGKGSHKIFRHPDYDYPIVIPDHGSKELHPGLIKAIMKQING